jgi:thymidylate synthase
MIQYLDLLKRILTTGTKKEDRTGVGTISVFGEQLKFDLSQSFPALTTKKLWMKGVIHELLWMIKGDTNIKYLVDNGVHIWDQWADENGDLGRVYGDQWRNWRGYTQVGQTQGDHYTYYISRTVDQLDDVIEQIKTNPNSRRHLVSAWNPAEVEEMKLPPCHYSYLFNVTDNKISCMFTMRSVDTAIGLPFNIASYALLTHMVAQVCNLEVGNLVASLGDTHIYLNHIEQVKEQLSRIPYDLPKLWLNPEIKNIDDFKYEDIKLQDYVHHPSIKMQIAV